jgi:prolyl oligopeptidase
MRCICIFLLVFHCLEGFNQGLDYPQAPRHGIADTLWGTVIEDPYRWLENINSDQTRAWLTDQKKLQEKASGRNYRGLTTFLPVYSGIKNRPMFKDGKFCFVFKIDKIYKTRALYYATHPGNVFSLLFDPSRSFRNRDFSIDDVSVSCDNRTIALVLSENAGDWKTIRFLDIESKKMLDDSLMFVKYSGIHWHDDGVFYIKYDVEDISESFTGSIKGRTLYYHKLGTSQQDDIPIYKPDDEYEHFGYSVTPGKNFLILYQTKHIQDIEFTSISAMSLHENHGGGFKEFIISPGGQIYFNVIGELDGNILVHSNLNAPNGMIYLYDPSKVNQADVFVAQFRDQLEYARPVRNNLLKIYRARDQAYAVISDLKGNNLTAWRIPAGFTFNGFNASGNDSIAIYSFSSFVCPPSFYKINLDNFKRERLSEIYTFFETDDLVTEKVYYHSKDSTLVPMYLTYKKGMRQNGNNPTILYGYGGFGISMNPFFDVANISFLRNGGLLATPALRGGGDFPGWHEQGRRLNKQNTIDDFIAAAGFLIANNYTNPKRIAAMGGSNGGLVVAAAMVQRPDLFKAVVASAGVHDMMRYHLFNIGHIHVHEFGNVNDSVDFANLLSYSPLHNVQEGVDYPATLLVASGNDDRVLPFHSFKLLAELQAKGSGSNPYILYFDEHAGHSGNHIMLDRIETRAYIYAFIFQHLNMGRITYTN